MTIKSNYRSFLLRIVVLSGFLSAIGCKNDACEKVICVNGTCVNGDCLCDPGYEGPDCSIRSIEKFVGSWAASDDCDGDLNNYTATIATSSGITDVLIVTNLGGLGSTSTAIATVSGLSIVIGVQDIDNGYTVSGDGVINATGTHIAWTYNVSDSIGEDVICSAEWYLQ